MLAYHCGSDWRLDFAKAVLHFCCQKAQGAALGKNPTRSCSSGF